MKIKSVVLLCSTAISLTACGLNSDAQNYKADSAERAKLQALAEVTTRQQYDASARKMMSPHQAYHKASRLEENIHGYRGFAIDETDNENYLHFEDNGIKSVAEEPLSTFSVDVDTASYSNVRRMINAGRIPASDVVRVEEMLNYFSYDEKAVVSDTPFSIYTEVGPTPWNSDTRLLRVSLKAAPLKANNMKHNNLVFLIDVSGSMQDEDKLPLLKKSLKLLSRQLDKDDRVSIVVYAGSSGMVLEPTAGNELIKIEQALNGLQAGGSTNGGSGIILAYQLAQQAFIEEGNNRVILATDGDFNVGTVDHNALVDLVKQQRDKGIYLTTLGFGQGNYNDALMEQLADKGNGNYAYIDNLMEAKKVLVDEIGSTLETVAKDVKIQVEFNPSVVSEYRLIGYENRHLAREDFNNDRVDAGEIGAGHSVMALYEVSMLGSKGSIDPLRYGNGKIPEKSNSTEEIAYVKLRYKPVDTDTSILKSIPVKTSDLKNSLAETTDDYRFASAVAAYGQKLRGGKFINGFSYAEMSKLAEKSRGEDRLALRSNFLQMISLTQALDSKLTGL